MTLGPLPFWLVNAFTTDSPHSGNQAGVVVFPANDPRETDDEYKQKIARDIDHAETAFLKPLGEGRLNLRWWTPTQEVTLCGHATLASARVIFSLYPDLDKITFDTRWSGELRAEKVASDGNSTRIKIFLPTLDKAALDKLEVKVPEVEEKVAEILGVKREEVLRVSMFEYGSDESMIVQLSPSVKVEDLAFDPQAFMPEFAGMNIITQIKPDLCSTDKLAIYSRMYCPGLGGPAEDPVTGSAHAYMTAYYLLSSAQRSIPTGVVEDLAELVQIDAKQVSARGGSLLCNLEPDGSVGIVGTACEMAKGTLSVW